MVNWQFCFLTDEYYKKFPNHGLAENKEEVNGKSHNRPCFFAFADNTHKEILWLVPVSSQYDKYRTIYDKNIERYGRCSFIRFGEFLIPMPFFNTSATAAPVMGTIAAIIIAVSGYYYLIWRQKGLSAKGETFVEPTEQHDFSYAEPPQSIYINNSADFSRFLF